MNAQKSPFKQAADMIEQQFTKVQSTFGKMKTLENRRRMPEAYEAAFDLAAECEKLALLARALPHYAGHPLAMGHMEKSILQSVPVSIDFTDEGRFIMRFPALLPKKERGSPEYVRGFLYPAMKQFFDTRPRFRFNDCVIIFRHIYNRARPERQYRDHDNIELNAVVDLITLFLLYGDTPLRCFHFYCSAESGADETEVIVLPKANFICWLIGDNILKNGEVTDHDRPP